VVVSAHGSDNDLKVAPAFEIVSKLFNKSRVERASLSSRVTIRVSPGQREAIARAKALLSVTAPETFSAKTLVHPAAVKAVPLGLERLAV
jgi:hypothetical protein